MVDNNKIADLLQDMVSGDFRKNYTATENFKEIWRQQDNGTSNGQIKATREHLQILANARDSFDAEKAIDLVVMAHLSGTESANEESSQEREKRVKELGALAETVSGPHKELIIEALEKHGLQTPRMVEQKKIEQENSAREERELIGGFAAKGEITYGRFHLLKDRDGELRFGIGRREEFFIGTRNGRSC